MAKSTRNMKNVISWAKNVQMVNGSNHEGASSVFFYRDGRVHVTPEGKIRVDKFTLDDVTAIALTAPDGEVVRVSSGMRAAGGALAGGVLLGPAGLIAGAVVGNATKRKEGNRHALTITLNDGTQYTLLVKPHVLPVVEKLVAEIAGQIDA